MENLFYLLDAYEDMNEDEKKLQSLIRVKGAEKEKFDDYMHDIFVMMMSKPAGHTTEPIVKIPDIR